MIGFVLSTRGKRGMAQWGSFLVRFIWNASAI